MIAADAQLRAIQRVRREHTFACDEHVITRARRAWRIAIRDRVTHDLHGNRSILGLRATAVRTQIA
jgi:hypothetical protein